MFITVHGGNRFANSIYLGSRRRDERRKRRKKVDARCGNTECGVRRWTSVKNKLTQLRRVHRMKFVVCCVIQRKCRSGTRRRRLNIVGLGVLGGVRISEVKVGAGVDAVDMILCGSRKEKSSDKAVEGKH